MGVEGLKFFKKVGDWYGMLVVIEVMDLWMVELVCEYSDMF